MRRVILAATLIGCTNDQGNPPVLWLYSSDEINAKLIDHEPIPF